MFIALAAIAQLVFPSHRFSDVDSGALDVMAQAGGDFLKSFFTTAYIAGAVGAALTSQATVARIVFAMRRDGVLPTKIFGCLNARWQTPVIVIVIVAVISLLAVKTDPTFMAALVSFGALAAFSIVNLSIIRLFLFDRGLRDGCSLMLYGLAPAIGFILTIWLWGSLTGRTLTFGLIWLALGVLWLLWRTRGLSCPMPRARCRATRATRHR